jgi:hypothetical protein
LDKWSCSGKEKIGYINLAFIIFFGDGLSVLINKGKVAMVWYLMYWTVLSTSSGFTSDGLKMEVF